MCVGGSLVVEENKIKYDLNIGETILLPEQISQVAIVANNADLLEIYL
jgi:hypothetical protein